MYFLLGKKDAMDMLFLFYYKSIYSRYNNSRCTCTIMYYYVHVIYIYVEIFNPKITSYIIHENLFLNKLNFKEKN